MNPPPGMDGVLLALAKLQYAESIPQVLTSCEAVVCLCAATIKRAQEIGALSQDISEPEIIESLMNFKGPIGRRRILAHLRNTKIITPDIPFFKIMPPGSAPSIRLIIRKSAERNGRTMDDVLGEGRRPESVMARFEAAWMCVRAFEFPVTSVAEILNKNHTTVLSGINKIDIMIQRSPIRLEALLETANAVDTESAEKYAAMIKP